MKNPQSAFILIHGAFRGGWSWDRVAVILRSSGHQVFAPSLTGAGELAHLLSPNITLDVWAKDVVAVILDNNLENVVLIGHSQGGIVMQAAAEIVPERISKMIFLDAPVLRDGEAAIDVIPDTIRKQFGDAKPDAIIQPVPVKQNEYFSDEDAAWINERLTAMPARPGFDKIRIERSSKIPHDYIFCSETPPFFPSNFTRQRFDSENIDYTLIDAPHDCILSHPKIVAEILIEMAKV